MDKIKSLKITQAVILAGGAGTRLKPFTNNNPKPMIPINGRPFLEYLLDLLKSNGIKEVIILIGYLGEKISQYFGDGKRFGIKIKYSYTPFNDYFGAEIKSGTRLLNAHELLQDHFLLMYCDNYWPLNLRELLKFFVKNQAEGLLSVYSNRDASTKNNLLLSEDYVKKYDKTRESKKLNAVDIGFMIINKNTLGLLPKANSKFEDIVFPKLISEKKLVGFLTHQKYYSIGDRQRVKKTSQFLKPKKIILLDRDGVINQKAPKANYIKDWNEFIFLPGSLEAIRILSENGYKIFIISNQAGIARKTLTLSNLKIIHKNMTREIRVAGGKIEGIYFCPHNWDEGCFCRKPKPGLLFQASDENLFDLTKSIFVGDDIRDKLAGDAAGCKTILVNKKKNLLNIVKSLIK